jgi:LmbE family N-acetylglucosaminyl deacetylase
VYDVRKAEASQAARVLNERRYQQLSAEEREDIARKAAVAMWKQRRENEAKEQRPTK